MLLNIFAAYNLNTLVFNQDDMTVSIAVVSRYDCKVSTGMR